MPKRIREHGGEQKREERGGEEFGEGRALVGGEQGIGVGAIEGCREHGDRGRHKAAREPVRREASGGESDPDVEGGCGGEGLVRSESSHVRQCGHEQGKKGAKGPGERRVEDEAGLARAEGWREGPARVDAAMRELRGGLLPAEEMEAEVMAARRGRRGG